jgi:thymidine kinase
MLRGELHLILGCMFSGKTSELLNKYDRYIIGGRKCMLIKYEKDKRYDPTCVTTHNNIKVKSYVCNYLSEVDKYVKDYDIIFIDEIQFYLDAFVYCEKWSVIHNKIIYVCGLNGTYDRKPFDIISKLIPLANSIIFKTAVCRQNGVDAIYSQRIGNSTNVEDIGGEDKYTAVDRDTYFKDDKILSNFTKQLDLELENLNKKP